MIACGYKTYMCKLMKLYVACNVFWRQDRFTILGYIYDT